MAVVAWFRACACGAAGDEVWVRSDAVQVFGAWTELRVGDGCKLRLVGGDEVFVQASVLEVGRMLGVDVTVWEGRMIPRSQER